MSIWLTYNDGEVEKFHPEFIACASIALDELSLSTEYEWCHHLRTVGVSTIPDFVLRKRESGKWFLAFEVKRSREAVLSTRFQLQAKGYAESNQDLFHPNKPKYFALSNFELTLLFALNGERPPKECQVKDGIFETAKFQDLQPDQHKQLLVSEIKKILLVVTSNSNAEFEFVWGRAIMAYQNLVEELANIHMPVLENQELEVVRSYFGSSTEIDQKRVFALACLMTEFIKGVLLRTGHPRSNSIPPLRAELTSLKNIIAFINRIDFDYLYSDTIPLIEAIETAELSNMIRRFIQEITSRDNQLLRFSTERSDYLQLLDNIMLSLYPIENQHLFGKIQTDYELSAVIASILIRTGSETVLDPCSGDGSLLLGAFDRFVSLGVETTLIYSKIKGIEVDALASKLATTRLLLRSPRVISPDIHNGVIAGDLFQNRQIIQSANTVVMNPPFIRYENQTERPVPENLKSYYKSRIESEFGNPLTLSGQPNIYNYYVEFVGRSILPGSNLGIILDNKWYHSKAGGSLRNFFLENFEILGIVEYPHNSFFSSWAIATSLVFLRKSDSIPANHLVKFIRCNTDPREVDLNQISNAFWGGQWPYGWSCNEVLQSELNHGVGWKMYFSTSSADAFLQLDMPVLSDLFENRRRGSLEKEGGGVQLLEFPFERNNYGPQRLKKENGTGFATNKGRELTVEENRRIKILADAIPQQFRGLAIRNADSLTSYELIESDLRKDETLESPAMRLNNILFTDGRVRWNPTLLSYVTEFLANTDVKNYIDALSDVVGMNEELLSLDKIWNVIREPIAGSLILPRKMRDGHRVHINNRANSLLQQQVRVSSNFVSFGSLNIQKAPFTEDQLIKVIAAFLISSFGQLQFEMLGYNREGCLSLELHQFEKIKVFNPLHMSDISINRILQMFNSLPYPIDSRKLSALQFERNDIDQVFAAEMKAHYNQIGDETVLLANVHSALDEWLIARQP